MTTIKAYTDIEQSRKLAEILPLESADMCYIQDLLARCEYGDYKPYIGDLIPSCGQGKIRCWSLAALLNILPKGTNISTPKSTNELGYCCWNEYGEFYADNIIDACYKMILKLHKLNLL